MKLKMKEWIERMTKAVKPSTCTEVTLPFTPPCNGLLIGLVRASAQGRCYVLLTNAAPGIIDCYQISAGYCVGAVFVTKNRKVEYDRSSNLASAAYYFVPLVGGVLRNSVISRLSAISKIGGGVNGTVVEKVDFENPCYVSALFAIQRRCVRGLQQLYKERNILQCKRHDIEQASELLLRLYCGDGLQRWDGNSIHDGFRRESIFKKARWHSEGLGVLDTAVAISERGWAA